MKALMTTLFSGMMLFSGASHSASAVLVWPIYQIIEADQKGSALWLENRGKDTVAMQIRILSWRQANGAERYADQTTIVASPPFTRIEPGQKQLVRMMRLAPAPAGAEQSYRILIDELPVAQTKPDTTSAAITLQMRYVLPLFSQGSGVWTQPRAELKRDPKSATQPILSWSMAQRDGKTQLAIRNTGTVHARLSSLYWGSGTTEVQSISKGFMGYVLPGQTMYWPLPAGAPRGQQLYAQLVDNAPHVAIAAAR